MGRYQTYRGNPENKLFYVVDQLVGGINTDFSDDTSPDNEFESIVNFNMDKRGSLYKRMGFGKLNAVSEIFNMYPEIPTTKGKTPEDPNPELTNDNIVYMKMLRNDNNCFRNLSAFTGEKAYRDYQRIYGAQNNTFKLLMVTTSSYLNKTIAWTFECTLPPLKTDAEGNITEEETIIVSSSTENLPVLFNWDRNLQNIDTIEFFDKIYFTGNNKGLVMYDRENDSFSYSGMGIEGITNGAYKPTPMEIRKVGFNVLGDNPLRWVDYQGLTTESIQGIYLTQELDIPLTVIPSGGKFKINVLYTGPQSEFTIAFKEGDVDLSATITKDETNSVDGVAIYDIIFSSAPTSQVEIKIEMVESELESYYDYYEVGSVDPETKKIAPLNIGDYGICEMYNRAVYYKDDTIWFSEINNFNYIPNYNYVALPIEPTDKITKVVFFKNVYIIFTKQRIYKMLDAFGGSSFQVMPVNLSIGCHAPNTVIPIENELYFASPRGLYALKSSEYREGIENLKELDTKVKQLTSNVTMFLSERTDPAVRYNGISERAYAVRYKDKYMLFFNTAFESGDVAALRNLDALVYQYDLKAFSEIKFPIKPSFLFMVDNAITTFMTVPEKEEYTVEETIIEYDFENSTGEGNKIKDLSGNNLDADMVGGVVLSPGTGILLNDGPAHLKSGIISDKIDLEKGFKIKMNYNLQSVAEGLDYPTFFSLKQNSPSGETVSDNGVIETSHMYGFRYIIDYVTIPNIVTKENIVNWTLRAVRLSNIEATSARTITLNLKDTDSNKNLISNKTISFNMGSELDKQISSGSFIVTHDSDGSYSKNWNMHISSSYPSTTQRWVNGAPINFDITQYSSWSSYYGIRIVGTASVNNGVGSITYTPYMVMLSGASIAVGSRNMRVYLDGETKYHSISSMSGSGPAQFSFGAQTKTKNYTGSPGIFIDATLDIKANIGGYKETLEINGFWQQLPKTELVSETTWINYDVETNKTITFTTMLMPSLREIALIYDSYGMLRLKVNSEFGTYDELIMDYSGFNPLGEHELNFKVESYANSSGPYYLVTIGFDNMLWGTVSIPVDLIVNGNRDNCTFGEFFTGGITNLELSSISDESYIIYKFLEGSGTKISDLSGNKLDGSLVGNVTWETEKGIKFDGLTGHLILPSIEENVRFSNGFSIEFESKFANVSKSVKVFDLATSYDSTQSGRCSINAGTVGNSDKIDFSTRSITNKQYSISKEDALLLERVVWKIDITDTGKDYLAKLYRNGEIVGQENYNYGGITNILRRSNFIGKSNNPDDSLFEGMLYNFKIITLASASPVTIYEGAMFEYDTTFDDFGRPMEIELETKGINLQYPMHSKKLKNIFVKGLGGFNYNNFFFEVLSDGHLVNDPKKYNCYIDEVTKQVVYDYTDEKILSFNEMISLLGNMRLDRTRLGESSYETRKLVIPSKGKNFTVKIYGESADSLGIESIGFTFKLGKVREE